MEKQLVIPSAEPFLFTAGSTGCVLVHGFTGTPKEMRLMGEALYKKGITSLGVRLAGHATESSDLRRTLWKDWLVSVEDGIHMLSGICDKVFIAGLSLGGLLSLISAARYPILKGAIAIAAPYSLGNDWRLKFAKPLSAIIPSIDKPKSSSRVAETSKEHIDYPQYPTKGIVELNDLIKVMHQSLPEINIPVLLVNSDADQTVPLWHAEMIQKGISQVHVERMTIKGSGHVITEDTNRDRVFDAAYQFMMKHGG